MLLNNKRLIAVTIASLALSNAVMAETPPQTPAEQIRVINERNAILAATLAEIDLKTKIATKTEELRKLGMSSGQNGGGATNTFNSAEDLPIVRAIDGVDKKLKATLLMRNGGGLQTVGEGNKFGAWTIKTISINSVSIVRGTETTRLTFGTDPASSSSQSAPGQSSGPFIGQPGSPVGVPPPPGFNGK